MRVHLRNVTTWAACGLLTSLIAHLGIAFGSAFLHGDDPIAFIDAVGQMDARNYRTIADEGYTYREREPSNVAFFPAYPLIGRWAARGSRLPVMTALLVISNVFFVAATVLLGAYSEVRQRSLRLPPGSNPVANQYALLAMGLLPTTFFFRMPYSESMFLFFAMLSIYGMSMDWPPIAVALVIGLVTAIRPVGISLLLPLLLYAWQKSTSRGNALARIAYLLPLACWGLVAFMIFQWVRFGDPMVFAITQKYHRVNRPIIPLGEELLALLSSEPVRDVYNRSSEGSWQMLDYSPYPIFSFIFVSPIYLLGSGALIAVGAAKRWLTTYEVLVAVPLLVIPYLTRGYEMRMMSQARFTAVVFPVYIVLGRLLARMPTAVSISFLALSAAIMSFYAAIFSTGKHSFF